MNEEACPCGSGKTYEDCCAPYLAGRAKPTLPVQLMRSRYSAFCKGNVAYLVATHHPTKRKADDRQTLARTIAETEWLGLRVLDMDESRVAVGKGTVEFVAFYKSQGKIGQLHEKSEFIRQSGRWYYLQGVMLPPVKIERGE